MSEKKSNHVKEKYNILKMRQCGGGGSEEKAGCKIHQNQNNSAESQLQRTRTE